MKKSDTPKATIGKNNKHITYSMYFNKSALEIIGAREIVFNIDKMEIRQPILEEKRYRINGGHFSFGLNGRDYHRELIGVYEVEKDGETFILNKL